VQRKERKWQDGHLPREQHRVSGPLPDSTDLEACSNDLDASSNDRKACSNELEV
jgi:hypothetical protein